MEEVQNQDQERIINFKYQEGPQYDLLRVPVHDILYGGARGGGKSYGMLGHFAAKAAHHRSKYGLDKFRGLLVRRTYAELEEIIGQGQEIYKGIAEFKKSSKTFEFYPDTPYPNATLKMRFLERDDDAAKYQGHQYNWICIEEAGNFPAPEPIDKLRACLRSPRGGESYFLMTANPGGVGHNWLKTRYIDPSPPGKIFKREINLPGGRSFSQDSIFIPSKVQDNKLLLANDPGYIDRLAAAATGQDWLLRAWLDGNWDIVAGGMFDDLWDRNVHVIEPFKIPSSWTIHRAYDWGSAAPFSVGWWAVSDGESVQVAGGATRTFPRGTLFRIDEWYGWNGQPNQGVKMLERDIARGIKDREKLREWKEVKRGPADNMIFDVRDGRTLADEHRPFGVYWARSDKSPGSRITGWQDIRKRLSACLDSPMEWPGLFVFSNCKQFIRTFPVAARDKKKLEDVDTDTEDHIIDETRYMVRFHPMPLKKIGLSGV